MATSDEWGVNSDYGFLCPTLTEVIEDTQSSLQNKYGSELNINPNSKAGMLSSVQANREFKVWQQMEAVYYSQTKNGAEGDYMDELYGYQGVTRNDAAQGSGNAVVLLDYTVEDIETVTIDTTFTTSSGVQYLAEETRTVSDYVRGYKIDDDSLITGAYYLTVVNSDNTSTTCAYSLTEDTDEARETFFNNLKDFFDEALPDDTDSIIVDTTEGDVRFFVGYSVSDDDYLLTGTEETFSLKFTDARIGTIASEHAVLADEEGYNEVGTYSLSDMTPTPDGYVEVTNVESFYSGSDVETDAEFSVRAETISDAPTSSTRPAIIAALLEVDNVSSASFNKTVDEDTGLVSVEPVIFGGESEDIAEVLYNTQPIDCQYIGDISYTVQTDDNKTEDIYFSRGSEVSLYIRVTYTPINGISLATTEQTEIQDSIEGVNSYTSVGGTVFNGQLSGAVFDVNPQRFSQMTIYIKEVGQDDSEYATGDYTPDETELPVLSADYVEILQVS